MKNFFIHIQRQQLALFFCALLMVALVYSPFLLSVSMIGLVFINVFNLEFEPKVSFGLNPKLKQQFQIFFKHKGFLVITLFFFIVLVSGLWSEDLDYWLERLRLKVPFLTMPFAFVSLAPFSKRQYWGLFYFLLVLLTVTSIGIGVNYLLHFDAINESMLRGHPIPTPRNHIRFSLLLTLGIVGAYFLIKEKFYWRQTWEQYLIKGMTLFLFIFIHILSVRSGLFVLYVSIVFLAGHYIYETRQYLAGLSLMAMVLALPILAYHVVPSFKNKIDYMVWDMKMYQAGTGEIYSDAARLTSLEIGLRIGHAHPILGIGAGDLRQAVKDIYHEEYPDTKKQIMPHNQFVSVYAGTGLVGLALFVWAFFYPLFYKKAYQEPFFLVFHLIVLLSFMVENTIENSMGIGFYVFFLCLGMNRKKPD